MKIKKIVLALIVALMGTIVMNAQPPRRHEMNPEKMVEKRVERLDRQLGLTDAQKAEITRIYAEEMKAMHKDKPERMEKGGKPDEEAFKARHEQMEEQRKATDAKIEALLTPEQAAKFAEMKNERGEARHGRNHKGPRGGADKAPRPDGCCGNCCCKDNK